MTLAASLSSAGVLLAAVRYFATIKEGHFDSPHRPHCPRITRTNGYLQLMRIENGSAALEEAWTRLVENIRAARACPLRKRFVAERITKPNASMLSQEHAFLASMMQTRRCYSPQGSAANTVAEIAHGAHLSVSGHAMDNTSDARDTAIMIGGSHEHGRTDALGESTTPHLSASDGAFTTWPSPGSFHGISGARVQGLSPGHIQRVRPPEGKGVGLAEPPSLVQGLKHRLGQRGRRLARAHVGVQVLEGAGAQQHAVTRPERRVQQHP